MAGGSDLLDQLKQHRRTPRYVINLKSIPNLRSLNVTNDQISIGALTTLGELERHAELRGLCAALVVAASRVATPQIRNVGTIGGNLLQDSRCPYYRGPWYCYRAGGIQCDARHGENQEHAILGGNRCYTVSPSDTAPALIALDARVTVRGADSREMPLEDLFMPPGENITVMHRLTPGTVLSHITVPIRSRNAVDIHQVRDATVMGLRPRQCRGRLASGRRHGSERSHRARRRGSDPVAQRGRRAGARGQGARIERQSSQPRRQPSQWRVRSHTTNTRSRW